MATHVALLRGINVGGRNKVAMGDLRKAVESLGYSDVATYIQSGNVVFTADKTDQDAIATALETAIAGALQVRPRVVIVPCQELARVVRGNPYADEPNPKAVHAIFLSGKPEPAIANAVEEAQRQAAQKGSRDTVKVVGRVLYLHTPDGYGRSDLATLLARLGDKTPSAAGTARNWATVMRLHAMCHA
jgi:uncharacterized protein (DUF1697 family)